MADSLAISSPNLGLVGPWYTSPLNGLWARTGWQGSYIACAWTGTDLMLTVEKQITDTAYGAFQALAIVYVDGGAAQTVNLNPTTSQTVVTLLSGLANTAHVAYVMFYEGSADGVAQQLAYTDVSAIGTSGTFSQWTAPGPYVECVTDSIGVITDSWTMKLPALGYTPVVVGCGGILASGLGMTSQLLPSVDTFYKYAAMPNFVPPTTVGANPVSRVAGPAVATVVELTTNDAGAAKSTSTVKTALSDIVSHARTLHGANFPVVLLRPFKVNGTGPDPMGYGPNSMAPLADAHTIYGDTSSIWSAMTYRDSPATHPDSAGMLLLANFLTTTILNPLFPRSVTNDTTGRAAVSLPGHGDATGVAYVSNPEFGEAQGSARVVYFGTDFVHGAAAISASPHGDTQGASAIFQSPYHNTDGSAVVYAPIYGTTNGAASICDPTFDLVGFVKVAETADTTGSAEVAAPPAFDLIGWVSSSQAADTPGSANVASIPAADLVGWSMGLVHGDTMGAARIMRFEVYQGALRGSPGAVVAAQGSTGAVTAPDGGAGMFPVADGKAGAES